MSVEEYEEPPVPAMRDVAVQKEAEYASEFDKYASLVEGNQVIAETSLDSLCIKHGCRTPEELVAQPFPSEGPLEFMENLEEYACLPNAEALVLKAVQSNTYATLVFMAYFIMPQFFIMESYEAILKEGIKVEKEALAKKETVPVIGAKIRQYEENNIIEMKKVKQVVEEKIKSGTWPAAKPIPLHYKAAADNNETKLLTALTLMIEHCEYRLEKI